MAGILSTFIHFGVASLFVMLVFQSLVFSNISGFLTAVIWSYYAQSKFVFQSSFSKKKGTKFFIVQTASLFISITLASLFKEMSIYFKILATSIFLPACAFMIHKFWTFVEPDKK